MRSAPSLPEKYNRMPQTGMNWPKRQAVAWAMGDVVATVAALSGTVLLFDNGGLQVGAVARAFLLGLTLAAIVVATFARAGLYRTRTAVLNLLELQSVLRTGFAASTIFLASLFMSDLFHGRRWVIGIAAAVVLPALLIHRRAMAALRAHRQRPNERERTLVYGYNEAARLLMKKIVQAPEAGRQLVGFVDDFAMDGTKLSFRIDRNGSAPFVARLLGRTPELPAIVRKHRVTEVLISSSEFLPELLNRLGGREADLPIKWGIAAHFGTSRPDELVVEDVGAIPVLHPIVLTRRLWSYLIPKRMLDLCLALSALVLTLPVWALIAFAIWLETGSPVLFRQQRVGKDGRPFVMIKFRSLQKTANPYQSSTTLPRNQTTRVGRVLRATTLDELPQLLNVLRGEMSLVGPRPEMPFWVEAYPAIHSRRLTVQPGITGVWQLSADRHGMEIHENIEFDLFYIAHRSFTLDLIILFETVVFTTSAIRRLLFPGQQHSEEHSQLPLPDALTPGERRYALVALDQRRAERLRDSWARAARSLHPEVPAVVLASKHNVAAMRSILREMPPHVDLHEQPLIMPYRTTADFRALLANAQFVITDVGELGRIAQKAGTNVLHLPQDAAPTSDAFPDSSRSPDYRPRRLGT